MSDAWVAALLELLTIVGTALGVLVTIWPPQKKGRPILIVAFAGIAVLASGLVWIQASRASIETGTVQKRLDDVLSIERQSQRDRIEETAADRAARNGIQSLIDRGFTLREGCEGVTPSGAEIQWVYSVQAYLARNGRSDDANAFVHSSEIFPDQACFPRISGYMDVLEKIRDGIPAY